MLIGTFFTYISNMLKRGEAPSIDAAVEMAKNIGIQAADYDIDCINTFGIDKIVKLRNDFNLTASTYIYGFDFDYKDAELIKSIKEITRTQLEYCAKLGSTIFMPVPCVVNKFSSNDDRLEARKVTCDYMAYVCSLAKPMGITGVLENHSSSDYTNAIVEDFDYYLENVPDMRYVLDTGNYSYMGLDMMVACEKYKDKTVHVHLKDFKAPVDKENLIYTAVGDGAIKNVEAIKTLQAAGFDGALSIETCNLERSVEYLRKNFKFEGDN